jgi:small GTP-binding protein
MSEDQIPVYKVIVAGDGNVGKTSMIRQFCEGKFEHSRVVTLGVDFQIKQVEIGAKPARLSIWDVAGQDKFTPLRDTFYRGAHAVALVYDVTAPATFFNLRRWRDEIQSIVPGVPMVVIGNKIDLYTVQPPEDARAWAKSMSMPFLQTSAATGENIEEFFKGLAYLAMLEYQKRAEKQQ